MAIKIRSLEKVIFHAPAEDDILTAVPGKIILSGSDPERVTAALKKHRGKVVRLDWGGHLKAFPPPDVLGDIPVQIRIGSAMEAVEHFRKIPKANSHIRLTNPRNLLQEVRVVASMDLVPDILEAIPLLTADELTGLLDYYLHHDNLKVPVEPFHSILSCLIQSINIDLWQMHHYWPEKYLFVDGEGRVAFSFPELEKGEIIGRLGEPLEKWESSDPWRRLDDYFSNMFSIHEPCAVCKFFFLCRGWAWWALGTSEPVLLMAERLQRASRELAKLRVALG